MMDSITYAPVGDSAVTAVFGNTIAIDINHRIRRTVQLLTDAAPDGIEELVPTYCSLLVAYNPLVLSYDKVCEIIATAAATPDDNTAERTVRVIEIPTLYGGDYGPDLDFVSQHAGLSADEVVKRHSRPDYPVYMLGFIPGFAYLGGMDESIAAPRLSSPRTHVPKGSVGIANTQTGVYPTVSPGGWQLIGRTPIELYDERKAQPALLQAGDYVHYAPITEEEYLAIQADVDNYVVKTYVKKESELCE